MNFGRSLHAALFAASCLIPLAADAQKPIRTKSAKDPDAEIKNVAIDAIVTGEAGKIVPGLTSADFEINQEGEKQKIIEVSFIESKSDTNLGVPGGGPIRWPGMALPQDSGGMIAIVVDDFSLTLQEWLAVRATIKRFVTEKLRPGEFLSIIPASGGPVYLQQFTADKDRLETALAGIKFNPESGIGPVDPQRAQAFASAAVLSLHSVLRGLRAMPGRKTVVFFSGNMWLFRNPQVLDWYGGYDEHGLKARQAAGEAMASLTASANLASVVFYTADPRGLIPGTAGSQMKEQIETYAGLGRLAKDTGGIFFDNTNDVSRVLDRVEQESRGYYKIVFASTASDQSGSLPFLRATVKLRREGLNVRSRTGLLKLFENAEGAGTGGALVEMMDQVASPFAFGDLRLGLTTVFLRAARNELFVDVLMLLHMEDLSYVLEKDGARRCKVEVISALIDQSGSGAARTIKGYEMKLKREEYESLIRAGLPIRARLLAKKPGVYQVVAAVRDMTSGKIGANRHFIDITDLQNGVLDVSGVTVSGTGAGFAIDATTAADKLVKDDPLMVTPMKSDKEMNYSYVVFNAKTGTDKRAQLETSVRLFRNGQQVFSSEPFPVSSTLQAAAARLRVGGKLGFKESIASGDYSLQVIVKDTLAAEGAQATASQYINFDVQ